LEKCHPRSRQLPDAVTIEQLVNGWQHGFEGPEDRDDLPQFVVEEIVAERGKGAEP
jgi:hypothetical protein